MTASFLTPNTPGAFARSLVSKLFAGASGGVRTGKQPTGHPATLIRGSSPLFTAEFWRVLQSRFLSVRSQSPQKPGRVLAVLFRQSPLFSCVLHANHLSMEQSVCGPQKLSITCIKSREPR